jgi:hypothetical protein
VDGLTPRFVDETEWGFGWVSPEKARIRMTGHALAADGRVWLVDPPAADVEGRIRALGEPAGVIQLLDRHNRACEDFAGRLGVPHHRVPSGEVDGAPFQFVSLLRRSFWSESALWWPERHVLVCADALGTVPHYFALGDERLGVHPLLRATPPRQLGELEPEHVLCGHGAGVHENATAAVRDALATARRRLPRLLFEPALALRAR